MTSISTCEPSLSSRAMLCSLSISMWSARKHDAEAPEEIAPRHGAQADAGRYHSAAQGDRRKQIPRGAYPDRTRARSSSRKAGPGRRQRVQNDMS